MHQGLPILDVNHPLDRQALLDAHDRRCRYCGEPLSYVHLEIDHIIPKNLRSDLDTLHLCLRHLELPEDYNLDRIDNLLPVHDKCNREKSGALHVHSALIHYRALATRAAEKFTKLRARLSKQKSAEPDLAKMAKHISGGTTTLEEVANVATNSRPFSPTDDVEGPDFVRLSEARVRVECKLPTVGNPGGSAIFTFHSLQLRGAQIEVDHQTLIRELFSGVHAPCDPRWRCFLEIPSKSAGNYHLRVGPVSVRLDSDEAIQFCRLLDRLYPVYARAFKKTEIVFAGLDSPLKAPGVYEIASVPLALWQQMEAFVRVHDLSNGQSDWHVFDAPAWVWLKVIRRTPKHWDYRCFLDVVVRRPGADPRGIPYSSVSFRWVSSQNLSADTGWCWAVNECADFVHNRLIPKVKSANWVEKSVIAFEPEHMHVSRYTGYEEVTAAGFTSPERAAASFEIMQPLYLCEHDQFIPWPVVNCVLTFLSHLLEHHQLPSYAVEYIGSKIGSGWDKDPSRVTKQVRALLAQKPPKGWMNKEALFSGTAVDHALRCVREVLRKGEPDYKVSRSWLSWVKEIEPLISDYNERNYLVRMRAEHNDDE